MVRSLLFQAFFLLQGQLLTLSSLGEEGLQLPLNLLPPTAPTSLSTEKPAAQEHTALTHSIPPPLEPHPLPPQR